MPQEKRIEPKLPSGFRDYGPREAIARQEILEKIRTTFERFGFDPIETPAVERTEVLTGGEATAGKIIFNVKGSEEKESDPLRRSGSEASKSLRFDLTVPLARFLAVNPDIPKPFKRYQIGNVWRGERAQAGRYREFLQADIDIVGSKSLDADAEVVAVMAATMRSLAIDNFIIEVNFRDEALALLAEMGVGEERGRAALIAVDKKDKLARPAWEKEVARASGLTGAALAQYLGRITDASIQGKSMELRERAAALGVPAEKIRYNASMVRGLGYYTGAIFETILTDAPEIGSVFAGGRYDGLTTRFSPLDLPAVGASIGVDRLFVALEKLGTLEKKETKTQVLILNLIKGEGGYAAMRKELQDAGINTAFYLGDDDAFQAQLAYALKKGIPYVVLYGEEEKQKGVVQIKNLATREQTEVAREKIVEYFRK